MRQVLVNLLTNAVKFTAQGMVLVEVKPGARRSDGKSELLFSVKDTGIGIPADRMDRLFQSFTQVDSSTTRLYGGTGLGLAICKQIGRTDGRKNLGRKRSWAKARHFYFTIVGKPAQGNGTAERRAELAGRRVLAVDDLEVNRRILTRQLESQGMQVVTAVSAHERSAFSAPTAASMSSCSICKCRTWTAWNWRNGYAPCRNISQRRK